MTRRHKLSRSDRNAARADRAATTAAGMAAGVARAAAAVTARPSLPILDGLSDQPRELTGRAAGTTEDLNALFTNTSPEHLADGFRGGSDDEQPSANDQADGTGPATP